MNSHIRFFARIVVACAFLPGCATVKDGPDTVDESTMVSAVVEDGLDTGGAPASPDLDLCHCAFDDCGALGCSVDGQGGWCVTDPNVESCTEYCLAYPGVCSP